ncbi:MAG: hypothetical protein AAF399_17335, partial [Bacteroidota bacterium]
MDLVALLSTFPTIAIREMRIVKMKKPQLYVPKGSYLFMEYYCSDPECDCRRVQVQVFAHPPRGIPQSYAILSYGWEDEA